MERDNRNRNQGQLIQRLAMAAELLHFRGCRRSQLAIPASARLMRELASMVISQCAISVTT
jgi:hypothetical protein